MAGRTLIAAHTASTPEFVSSERRAREDRSEHIDRLIHESYTLLLRAKAARDEADKALIAAEVVLEQLKRYMDDR